MIERATCGPPKRPVARLLSPLLLLAASALFGGPAQANGRFPNAGFVAVGPGGWGDTVALQLTFGFALSRDRGRTWGWICEEAFDVASGWDPPALVGPDGALTLSLLTGLRRAVDGCSWGRPGGSPAEPSVDLAADATGRYVVAASGRGGELHRILRSEDGGATFVPGASLPGVSIETVEVAPSRPARVYVSGQINNNPVLYRSDDGGATVREVTREFDGGYDAYLSGVDPRNPDVVYLRVSLGLETRLLRSDDGGTRFTRISLTRSPMLGFALSDDGNTVWTASADEGLQRSVGGAAFVATRSTIRARCLRFAAGALYACGDSRADGFALARSVDAGDSFGVLLRLPGLPGPLACPAGTPGTACPALWPATAQYLRDQLDAGPPPADTGAPDTGAPALDAPASDASVPDVAAVDAIAPTPDAPGPHDVAPDRGPPMADLGPAPMPRGGCGCRVTDTPSPRTSTRGVVGMVGLCLALGLRPRRRRRSA